MKTLFVRVGNEETRGPLAVADVRAALASGVLPNTALAGTTAESLHPITVVLAALAAEEERGRSKRRKSIAIVIGAVLPLLVLGGGAAVYVKTRPPPLCPATPHILAQLKDRMEIRLYVSADIKKVAEETKKIAVVLEQMKASSQGKLDYLIIDVSEHAPGAEEKRREASERGLQMTAIDDSSSGMYGGRTGYFGMVFSYRAERDRIPILTSADGIEFWIDNKIREVMARADNVKKRIGIVTGHHEVSISEPYLVPAGSGSPTIRAVITQYFPYYTLEDIDLRRAIPPEIEGLLVQSPTDDFKDDELRAIDDFVIGQSKPLAIVASAAVPAAGDARMVVTLATHGLEKLTGGYGLELQKDLVFDEASSFDVPVMTTESPKVLHMPFIAYAREEQQKLDATSPIFFRVPDVYFPVPSSIQKHEDRQPGAKFRVLARSSSSAVRDVRTQPIELKPTAATVGEGAKGEVILAASVEGKLTSAFKPGTKSARDTRVLVIGSSLFFQNPFARAGAPAPDSGPLGMMMPGGDEFLNQVAMPYVQKSGTTSILVFKNLVDWLTFEENMTTCLDIKPAEDTKKKK